LHPPAAGKLAPTERRARFDALQCTPADSDRYRHSRFLAQVADLAVRLGQEDLAFRLRARGMNMARSGPTFVSLQQGMNAVSDRDWPSAVQYLRRYERAGSGNSQQQEYLGAALFKLGQENEAQDYLEQALQWQINPGARAMQAQFLLSHDLKPPAAVRFRVAARLMPPGEGATINALNSLGNALNTSSPGEAATLWKINMLGPLLGTNDMTLDMYLKNTAVIRREQARAALKAGQFREAADHALAELAAMPGDVVGVEQLVPLFDEQGQQSLADEVFARSVASYARVCEKFPQAAAHRNLLARTSARTGRRLDEALALANAAIALDAANANYHATLAEVHLARGDKPAAIAAAEAGLALEPKHAVCERVLAKARS
jgi:tetratricopeptide (TPR) repeat protein